MAEKTLYQKGTLKELVEERKKRSTTPTPKYVMPDAPENIKLTKAEFVEKQRKFREKQAKLRAFEDELDKEEAKVEVKTIADIGTPEVPVENTLQAPKKAAGRPKKS